MVEVVPVLLDRLLFVAQRSVPASKLSKYFIVSSAWLGWEQPPPFLLISRHCEEKNVGLDQKDRYRKSCGFFIYFRPKISLSLLFRRQSSVLNPNYPILGKVTSSANRVYVVLCFCHLRLGFHDTSSELIQAVSAYRALGYAVSRLFYSLWK